MPHNDPCPSCDGDEYDEASGECAECGFELNVVTTMPADLDTTWDLWKPVRDC